MSQHFLPAILNSILTFICILIAVPASHGYDDNEQYTACRSPFNYNCGELSVNISYPFWANGTRPQYCGHRDFELKCEDNQLFPTIQIGDHPFPVLEINEPYPIMRISGGDILRNFCHETFQEPIIQSKLFSYSENVRTISIFYECSDESSLKMAKNNFSCAMPSNGFYTIDDYSDSRLPNLSNTCSRVFKVPFQNTSDNFEYLTEGKLSEALNWEMRYDVNNNLCSDCRSSEGICGSIQDSTEFSCLCRDQPYPSTCSLRRTRNVALKLGIGIGTVTTMGLIIICILGWKKISLLILKRVCWRKVTESDQDLEAIIRNYGPLAVKRYNFSEVKKLTNSFKDEIGQGGYGSVYKGKLSDGCLVAVKLLNKTSKGNGQEFINEVASIGRTSHVNVVTLLGFCLEGSKRALIYEFMPNGSLEKFIYNGDVAKPGQHLGWEKMCEIVIGIAKGLEYLHRGCNTRILHLDIKPHNILLDKDFCPKISDFGLAKICLKKESIVSMLEARGTIGYIAPEVFNRNFGEVSHKSDVYSYGMMILELAGCKNNFFPRGDQSSEMYFPHWIYKHFERDNEFEVPGIVSSEENEIAKKMIVVGLWCIQIRPSDRPPMNRVVEMLEGSFDALRIPPKPFASSPPRPPLYSSTLSTS